ncbi:YncE family protein [Methanosarcina sp. UBA411]|jgi:YVTN family beta-propeller protein|uniref:YncE family protein n=1 Tax=Methanosarcina sp. UBA411 TaxID=1915589 RepID=UPI0025EC84C5|nr:YncE family protein [Methanosarcina sp. UBA411]
MKRKITSTIEIATFSIPLSSMTTPNKVRRQHILIRALRITAFAILTLVSVAGAAPFAYVTSIGIDTGTVFVIDTATDNLTAVVPIEGWAGEAAINPAGTKVYVTDISGISTTISIIDTATNTVDAVVDVGSYPRKITVNPKGSRVYVTNRYSRVDDNSNNVSVVNTVIGTSTNTVMDPINMGLSTYDIAFYPDGKKIYATNSRNNTTSVIDATTNKIIAAVSVGDYPTDIAVSPDGNKVYVINSGSNNVSVIDTATNNVTGSVPVGNGPGDIAVSPDGTKIYVTNSGSYDEQGNTVSVIDAVTNKVIATVYVGTAPKGVAVTPDGKKAYVAISNGYSSDYKDNVSVIDTATNKVTATVNTGKYTMNYPVGVVIGPIIKPNEPFIKSNITDQSTKATSNETYPSTMVTLNTTENISVEETNLPSYEEKNVIELNNSNNNSNNDINNSKSDNGSNSSGNESSKNNSTPGFGLLGGLACLYGGWKLRKK